MFAAKYGTHFLCSLTLVLLTFAAGCKNEKIREQSKSIDALTKTIEQTPFESQNYLALTDSLYERSKRIGHNSEMERANSFKGNYFASKNQNEEALLWYQSAVKVGEKTVNVFQQGEDYNNIGRMFFRLKKREEAILAFKQAVKMRSLANDSTGLGSSLNNIGFLYWQISDFDSAVIFFEKALEIRNKLPNKEFRATTYNNLGTIFFNWSLYDKALAYYLHSLELQKEYGNDNGIALSLCNIGLIYKETAQNEKAIEYYRESLPYAFASKKLTTLGYTYSCFGAAFNSINSDSSLFYFKKSYETYKQDENRDGEILAIQGIGNYYLDLKDLKSAKTYFTEMLELAQKENILMRIAEANKYLGEIYLRENNLEKAEAYFENSIAISEKATLKVLLRDAYKSLSEIYERKGKIDKSFMALKQHNVYRQQIENEGMQKRLMDLKNKSEYERYQRNLQEQKHENEKQKIYLVGSLTAIIFLLVVAVVLYLMNSRRKKVNLLLQEKNILIEGQSKEINLKNVELLELNEAKEKLFSIIAHDLRSPFSTLINMATLIKEEYRTLTNEEKVEYITDLEETAIKTYELVENLLNLSASHTGRINFNLTNIDVKETVNKIINLCQANARKKEIQFAYAIEDGLRTSADQPMLEIILRNLVNNALKYCNTGGLVEITAKKETDKILFSIKDNGIGMDEATKATIFNINVIRSKKGTNGERGTGLGLGLCKEFVEKHGGKLWVESAINCGSNFIFTLPQPAPVDLPQSPKII